MSLPCNFMFILILHEFFHFIMFKVAGIRVTELKISFIKINLMHKNISLAPEKLFGGYCIVKRPEPNQKFLALLALASGGISGIIVSFISAVAFMKLPENNFFRPFLMSLAVIGLYSFHTTLIRKSSADHKAFRQLLCSDISD